MTRTSLVRRYLGSPLAIGASYLIAVPIFALVYLLLWKDLVQSTTSSDPVSRAVTDAAISDLSNLIPAVRSSLGYPALGATFRGSDPGRPQIRLTSIGGGAGSLTTLELTFDIASERYGVDIDAAVPIEIGFPTAAEARRCEAMRSERVFKFEHRQGSLCRGMLYVPLERSSGIQKYAALVRGRPVPVGREYGRYLYFSVVTITTLGYGDIVPVSDAARAIVAAEALFGVIIAGLFINAVARRGAVNNREEGNN